MKKPREETVEEKIARERKEIDEELKNIEKNRQRDMDELEREMGI
jgi:hypothetical protein